MNTEVMESARVLAKAYKEKLMARHGYPSMVGVQQYVRVMLAHESYNFMDQVEYEVNAIIFPDGKYEEWYPK